jgi:hypothetical protein
MVLALSMMKKVEIEDDKMVYLFTGLNSGNNRVAARNVFDH